jgi:crossover junction endodeoxyribonuclease RusA
MFEVFVPGTPRPQGSKQAFRRGSKIVLVESSKGLPAWRQQVIDEITKKEFTQFEDAVIVRIDFHHLKPKTVKRQFMTVAPDIDKLARAILDALTISKIIKDDSYVIGLICQKFYSDKEGAFIRIGPHITER